MNRSKATHPKQRSNSYVIFSWLATLLSIGLLYAAGNAVVSDFASFQSCTTNQGLAIQSCGKSSINFGDIVLVGLLVLSSALVVSLVTGSIRATKGRK